MRKIYFYLGLLLFLIGCKSETKKENPELAPKANITYAEGFTIAEHDGYKIVTITNAWPGAETNFTYALVSDKSKLPSQEFDAIIQVPVKSMVVTSTTHIPSLEALGVEDKLVGFPNLDYISSKKTRALIENESIKELGKNESINTEVLIDLAPDVVVTFAVQGDNKTVATIQKTGIPVVYNGDWTETHPLGKAEWIKFFGAFFDKDEEASQIFAEIESNYNDAKKLASQTLDRPTVMSGAMYKDIWYLPQGNSWAARFIEDANGEYLWKDTEGVGSLSLNLESVLEKAQNAEVWIGPGQFTSLPQMEKTHTVYSQFESFRNKKVHSFTTKKGATGGVIYYELAPNRPDLVLKDIIKILHPELLPEYESYFFTLLE